MDQLGPHTPLECPCTSCAGVLGLEVAPDQPLMEAGLDSIGAVELRNAVGAKFCVDLPATVTFDHPTPQALASFLAARVPPPQGGVASSGIITHALHMEEDSRAMQQSIAQVLPASPVMSSSNSCFFQQLWS